jgi:CheY-like chemotaxis protein
MYNDSFVILIVDDENASIISETMSKPDNVECIEAQTAVEAITLLKNNNKKKKIDLCIMDMKMPLGKNNPAVIKEDIECYRDLMKFTEMTELQFTNSNMANAGWWCAAYLCENNFLTGNQILYVTSYIATDSFEPFKKSNKLGIKIIERSLIIDYAKKEIEKIGSERFVKTFELLLIEDGNESAYQEAQQMLNDYKLNNWDNLRKFFPYIKLTEKHENYFEVLDRISIKFKPPNLPTPILRSAKQRYSLPLIKDNIFVSASNYYSKILNDDLIFISEATPKNRIKEIDEKKKSGSEVEIISDTFRRYLGNKVPGGEAPLIARLVLIGLLVSDFESIAIELDNRTTFCLPEVRKTEIGFKLGFGTKDKKNPVSGFRKWLNELGLTKADGFDPIEYCKFLHEEKNWIIDYYILSNSAKTKKWLFCN